MTKKEIIWRYILQKTFEKRGSRFTQKNIAREFGFSTSTVFNALKAPRGIHAIDVNGRFFTVRDYEKLLMLWATHRRLENDIIYSTFVNAPVREIEGNMPPNVLYGAWSGYRLRYDDAPADYDSVYIYCDTAESIKKRFSSSTSNKNARKNLFVLRADPWLASFGSITPDSQIFVDLWNLPEWYAKDFLIALKQRLNI